MIYIGFVNIRVFGYVINVVCGKYDDLNDVGEVFYFQVFIVVFLGIVGIGNIVGVVIVVLVGGLGVIFWMIVVGIFGMMLKFVECFLGVMYWNYNVDGFVFGGFMYYFDKGFKEKGLIMGVIGKVLAVFFVIVCIGGLFGGGNMVQVNQAVQ